MNTAYRFFLAAFIVCYLPASSFAQSTPAELKLEVLTANSTVVTIKAVMYITPPLMNVEAVSVGLLYDPMLFNINPATTISNMYFQSLGWEDASIVPWDPDLAVVIYCEYHPSFGTNPILRNNPPVLCHFNFYPKSTSPGLANFTVYGNTPTGALTYYFDDGSSQQQNFYPVTNLVNVSYPVELTSFTASQQGQAMVLRWRTANETNNYGFYIERNELDNGGQGQWVELDFVKGAGDSYAESHYLFIDQTLPRDGRYAYRLRQQDFDGSTRYSNPVIAEYRSQPLVFALHRNYPNPISLSAADAATIQYDIAETGNVRLTVSNILGQEVATLVDDIREAGRYTASWYPAALPAGNYIATLTMYNPSAGSIDRRTMTMQITR